MHKLLLACVISVCGMLSNVVAANPPTKVKYVVAFAQDTMANDWRAAQVRQIKDDLARQSDIEFVFSDAQGNTARQIQDIEVRRCRGDDDRLEGSPKGGTLVGNGCQRPGALVAGTKRGTPYGLLVLGSGACAKFRV